jgi:hypothetical protein
MGVEVVLAAVFDHLDLNLHQVAVANLPGFLRALELGGFVSKLFCILRHGSPRV